MHDSTHPARLGRSRRAHLLAIALPLLSGVLAAGCTGSPGSTPAVRGATTPASSPASAGPATASGSAAPSGPVTTVPTGPAPSDVMAECPHCHAPHQYRVAYGIQPLLDRGIDGRGETVTVLAPTASPGAAWGTTDIRRDLAAFDGEFGLPAARIQVVTTLAGAASPWQADPEEVTNFEILHTVAPAATLRVVLLPSDEQDALKNAATATADMLAVLRLAVSGTDVASINWGLGEHFYTRAQVAEMHSILQGAAAHHVTVDAGSGDFGASSGPWFGGTPVKEVSLPASDPLVLAVGGTRLTANPSTGAYISETAMGGPYGGGSGGGFSHLYARPAYQDGVPGISATRGVPDVAGAGQWSIPFVFAGGGKTWILAFGGVSISAPLWGGLMALADQYAHHDLGFVNPVIYRITRSTSYHQAFHDVTTGNNNQHAGSVTITGYQAAPGWDPVTGWGSPDAQVLVPLLARFTTPSMT